MCYLKTNLAFYKQHSITYVYIHSLSLTHSLTDSLSLTPTDHKHALTPAPLP
jgi:hypothetical protein